MLQEADKEQSDVTAEKARIYSLIVFFFVPSDGGRLFLSGYIKVGLIHTVLLLKAKLEFQNDYIKQWNPPSNNRKYYTLS